MLVSEKLKRYVAFCLVRQIEVALSSKTNHLKRTFGGIKFPTRVLALGSSVQAFWKVKIFQIS